MARAFVRQPAASWFFAFSPASTSRPRSRRRPHRLLDRTVEDYWGAPNVRSGAIALDERNHRFVGNVQATSRKVIDCLP